MLSVTKGRRTKEEIWKNNELNILKAYGFYDNKANSVFTIFVEYFVFFQSGTCSFWVDQLKFYSIKNKYVTRNLAQDP